MALALNLTKAEQSLKLCLQKSGVPTPPPVELAFVLDVSGSFDDEHRSGLTNALLTRLVPWGTTFDPDKKLDVYTFSSGARSAHQVGHITPANYTDYIRQHIIGKVPGYGTGTDYSPVLELVLRNQGWSTARGGLLQRLLGTTPAAPARRRSLVIFVTDGDNSDTQATHRTLAQSQQRGDQVYFLFIGVSNQGHRFPFLQQIAAQYSNTGLTVIRQLHQFTAQDDDQLNTTLLQPELIDWLKRDLPTAPTPAHATPHARR